MTEDRKLHYRYFYLSFALAFLVLSLLFLLLMSAVHPSASSLGVTELSAEQVSSYLPGKEEALTVLFVGAAPAGGADTFLLARFDPAHGKVAIVAFPRQTAVQNGDKTEALADVYKYGGADYTRGVLARTLGISIDRFVRMDVNTFIIAANTVGTVEYNLGHDLTLAQDGQVPVTLTRGVHLLDGSSAAEILLYEYYDGGELGRCEVAADLTAAIVNQRMDVALSTVVDKVFEKIINLIDTDITYVDYDDRKEAAAFLARLGQDPAEAIPTDGAFNEDNTLYTLSDTFLAQLTQYFV